MTRGYGRNLKGERVRDFCPRNKGKNVSIIGAISDEGLIANMTLIGGVDTEAFLIYLEKILLPVLWRGAIVVMDNLPVHHSQKVKILIESVGAQIKFLPPYSPDLSPIELCWSKLKEILRSGKDLSLDKLNESISNAIDAISDEDAINWFNHCGLFAESIR